jgi:uncharacterized glyoxalase superfamily protein PhnB
MIPRITVVTLGVADMAASVRFYEAFGFVRKAKATGDEIALFDAGGLVLALYPSDLLAEDAKLPAGAASSSFRGSTIACNCASPEEVDAVLARALATGARLLKPAQATFWGGYSGYFADPDGHAWEVVNAPMFSLSPEGRLILPE